jgi:hypothetical protein
MDVDMEMDKHANFGLRLLRDLPLKKKDELESLNQRWHAKEIRRNIL